MLSLLNKCFFERSAFHLKLHNLNLIIMYACILMHLSRRFRERNKTLLEPSAFIGLSVISIIVCFFYPLVIREIYLHVFHLKLHYLNLIIMYACILMHLSRRFRERNETPLEPSAFNGLSVISIIISIYFYP